MKFNIFEPVAVKKALISGATYLVRGKWTGTDYMVCYWLKDSDNEVFVQMGVNEPQIMSFEEAESILFLQYPLDYKEN